MKDFTWIYFENMSFFFKENIQKRHDEQNIETVWVLMIEGILTNILV